VSTFQILVIAALGTVATARLTRLLVADSFPPSAWVRARWVDWTNDGKWAPLVSCHWCASPYFAAVVFGSGYLLDWPTWWYVVTCWLSASYAAGFIVERDELTD
jgi:hypothetical protein